MNEEIRLFIANTLGAPLNEVVDSAEIGDIDGWDSIHQLMIISGLEEKYSIHFSEDDVFDMVSIGNIIDATVRLVIRNG